MAGRAGRLRRIWNNPLSLLGLEYRLPMAVGDEEALPRCFHNWSRMGKKAGGTQLHCSLWHQEAIALLVKFLDSPDWLTSCRAGWVSEHSRRRTGGMTSATKQRTLPSFANSSGGKESACNAGAVGSISRLGRVPGEGIRNPLQYSCLGNPMDRGAWRATVHGVTKYQTRLSS